MDLKDVLITIFLLSILIFAAVFIGELARQSIQGEEQEFTIIELSVILSAIILCIELAVVSYWKINELKEKRKPSIDELVKEARKITY